MEIRFVGIVDGNGNIVTADPEQQAQMLWAGYGDFWADQLSDPVTRAEAIVQQAWATKEALALTTVRFKGFDDVAEYDPEPDGYCNGCPTAVWEDDLNEDGLCPDCEYYDQRRLLGTPDYQLDEDGLAKKEALVAPYGRCSAPTDDPSQPEGCGAPIGKHDAEFGTCARYPDCINES